MQAYLKSAITQFEYYKDLGEKTISRLDDEQLFYQFNEESNSIATIVKHLSGNMRSRWTDFLSSDGEKEWRNRDQEFENDIQNREELLRVWEAGWNCLLLSVRSLQEEDLEKTVLIRNEPHAVIEAINRQLAHYPYHIGQIVFIGKALLNEKWESLSIPRGNSHQFNDAMFSKGNIAKSEPTK
ncbi:DUF1572 family protein [Pedobacter sp. SYSU D00535]|uniref:DUF1572 family protein n=1 Tax=Pedobacter sp. SYSU D00535 TaxID=2810308 RepID=UPI001A969393|nr:DUF1572 family protein [Pedobacter sp. SYSU D00535]